MRIFLIFFLFFFLLTCNRLADQINQIKATNNTENAANTENTDEKNTFFKNFCKEIGEKIRCSQKAQFGDPNQICLQAHWSTDEELVKKFNQHTSIDTQKEAHKNTTERREKLQYANFGTKEGFEKIRKDFINLTHRLEELISKNEYPECKKIVEKELAEGL